LGAWSGRKCGRRWPSACTPAACGSGRRWAQMRRGRGTKASWLRLSGYPRVGGHGRGRRGEGLGGGRLEGASRRCTGRGARSAAPRGKNPPFKWARRPLAACSRMLRRACRPTPRQACVTGGRRPTDRRAKERRGRRRLQRRHAGGDGFRGPRRAQHLGKERASSGTGVGEPGRRGRGGAASPARKQFTVPLFRHKNLPNLE
jgi:hypothetical protein